MSTHLDGSIELGTPTAGSFVAGTQGHINAKKVYVDGVEVSGSATTSASGIVELAITTEATTGTDTTRAVTCDALEDKLYGTFSGGTISDNGTLKAGLQELETAVEVAASTTVSGIVELAITTEATTGTDTTRAVTCDALEDKLYGTFTGSLLTDNSLLKTLLQETETGVENRALLPNKLAGSDFSLDSSFLEATSGATVADDTYAGALWNILSDGASVVSWAKETTIVDTNRIGSLKMTAALADKKFGMVYFIEQKNLLDVIGGTCSISFRARKDATTLSALRAAVIAWDSTADTVTSDVVSTWEAAGTDPVLVTNWTYENTPSNLTLTTAFQTFKVENISVDTSSTTNVALFIWVDDADSTANDDFYIDQISLQAGTTATAFPNVSEQEALMAVQRYYEKSGTSYAIANRGSTDGETDAVWGAIPFKVTKRIVPTMAITTSNISSVTTGDIGVESFRVSGQSSSASLAPDVDTFTATARF